MQLFIYFCINLNRKDHFYKPMYGHFCNKLYLFLYAMMTNPWQEQIFWERISLLVPSCVKFLGIHELFPMYDLRMRSWEWSVPAILWIKRLIWEPKECLIKKEKKDFVVVIVKVLVRSPRSKKDILRLSWWLCTSQRQSEEKGVSRTSLHR